MLQIASLVFFFVLGVAMNIGCRCRLTTTFPIILLQNVYNKHIVVVLTIFFFCRHLINFIKIALYFFFVSFLMHYYETICVYVCVFICVEQRCLMCSPRAACNLVPRYRCCQLRICSFFFFYKNQIFQLDTLCYTLLLPFVD